MKRGLTASGLWTFVCVVGCSSSTTTQINIIADAGATGGKTAVGNSASGGATSAAGSKS